MRRILLADADAFFVAVARAVDPAAALAPLLIVGGRPGSRGVVCSASYETRAFGVRSGMSISQALRRCPAACCVPVPRDACADYSRSIRRELDRFTPCVEGASIDEWYMDLTGTENLYRHEPLDITARRVRQAVLDATGMSISVGGGTSKLIAKLAAEHAKPTRSPGAGGVQVVLAGHELDFMRTVTLAEIPGIGPKLQATLGGLGLVVVGDVLAHDLSTLENWMGVRTAAWLFDRVRGSDDSRVEPRSPPKQMSREETFDRDIADTAQLGAELRHLAAKLAGDLRADGLAARTIAVKLRTADFSTRTASRTFQEPVESDRALPETAEALLTKLRGGRRTAARLVGVAVSNFAPARRAEQLSMFGAVRGGDSPEVERDRDLSRALDRVRARFGDSAIHTGPGRRAPIGEKGARKPRP